MALLEVDGILFAIPFRTHIRHKHSYIFKDSSRSDQSGLDFTKAVVVTDPSYIGEETLIDSGEYAEFLKKQDVIARRFDKFIRDYKKWAVDPAKYHEEAIQKAFVQSYTQTSNMNHDVAQETLARLRASLENEAYEDRIEEVSKEIRSLEKKIDQLLELRLAQKIPEDMYEEKFKRLNRKLEQKKGKREQLQLAQSKQASTEKRIQKIKNLLQSHEDCRCFGHRL